MRFRFTSVSSSRQRILRAFAASRFTLFGVTGLVMASAILGTAIPQVMPGQQSDEPAGSSISAQVKRVPGDYLSPLVGKKLRSATGADIGRVAGVLVDSSSEPRAVIVKLGGFLGVGVRTVAIDWQTLRVPTAGNGDVFVAGLAPQQLARAPQYKPDARSVAVVTVAGAGASTRNLGYGE